MTRTEDWADYLDPGETSPELPVEQRRALDRVTAALAAAPVWSPPPAGLRAALLEVAAREQAATEQATTRQATTTEQDAATRQDADDPGTTREPEQEPSPPLALRRRSRQPWYLAAAGIAAAAALVAVLAWPSAPASTLTLSGTALAPRASAAADLQPKAGGLEISLQIKGLGPAPSGAYYAVWLRGPGGIVPVGSFHWRKGGEPVELWSGVSTDRYPELMVTLQREGRPPVPSSEVVLSGSAAH